MAKALPLAADSDELLQQLRLLRVELFLRQDALGLEVGEPLERRHHFLGPHANQLSQGLQAAVAGVKPDDVMATIEKLGELKAKGILTDEEFAAKKAELLKKLA